MNRIIHLQNELNAARTRLARASQRLDDARMDRDDWQNEVQRIEYELARERARQSVEAAAQ